MKGIFILLLLIGFLLHQEGYSQDFTFSQFYEQPLLRNPALSGVFTGDIRVSATHRSQWGSVTVPFQTTSLSIESKFPIGNADDFLTAAAQMSNDVAGDVRLKRTQFMPTLNYHKSLSQERDAYLSLSFMGGIAGNQFDPTLMKLADQYRNGSYSSTNASQQKVERSGYSYWDASTGLSYSSSFGEDSRYYIGAALYHFTTPKVAFNSYNSDVFLQQRWLVNAGFNMSISEESKMVVFADYISQGGNRELLGGLMIGKSIVRYYDDETPPVVYVGSFVRWGDAVIPMVKMDMKNMSLGLSYDVNVSKLNVASNWRGGFELTASYKGFLRTHSSTLDKVRCVRF